MISEAPACGSPKGYRQHLRRGETPCAACRAAYDAYITWRRLTHNGHRSRDEMSPADQQEYDSYGFKREPPMSAAEQEEAKRLYEEVAGR